MSLMSVGDRVVIVGAGIVGIACAHFLVRAGFRVTVVDKKTIGGACSYGNCGYICPSHVLPLTQPGAVSHALRTLFSENPSIRLRPRASLGLLTWLFKFASHCNYKQLLYAGKALKSILDASITEYRNIISTSSINAQWQDSGLLYVLQSEKALDEFKSHDRMLADTFGIRAKRIEGSELPKFDASLKHDLAGAFFYENDAFVHPAQLSHEWSSLLREEGVEFIENCTIRSIEKKRGRVTRVFNNKCSIKVDYLVIAAGAWSVEFGKILGCRIPIEPGKGYSTTMARPVRCPTYPMLFPEHHIGVTPFEDGYRLGSMMELVGFDDSVPRRRIECLRSLAEPYLIDPYTETSFEEWSGWRPMTWDSLPIIGPVPQMDNAFLATGHNMLGMSLAASTGRLIAEQVQNIPTHIDASAYSPARF